MTYKTNLVSTFIAMTLSASTPIPRSDHNATISDLSSQITSQAMDIAEAKCRNNSQPNCQNELAPIIADQLVTQHFMSEISQLKQQAKELRNIFELCGITAGTNINNVTTSQSECLSKAMHPKIH